MNGWQSLKQDSRRARRWLLISLLLHLPFTPLGPLFGLVALISRSETAAPPSEELRGIPVELLEQQEPTPTNTAVVEEPPSAPTVAMAPIPDVPTPKPKKHKAPEQDAGLPDEADASAPDAGHPDDRVAQKNSESDAGIALAAADAGAPGENRTAEGTKANPEDALAASTHGLADSNANVRLSLFMDRVRAHPLGSQLGQLLKSVYQWRDFFAPAALDPVRDFDRIFLFGPQLRDSSQIAAFLQHNLRPARIHRAVDGLVKRSGGASAWLKGSRNPAARAVADRAQRLFVLYPNHVVAVVPPGAEKEALALPEFKLPQAKDDEVARAFVKTPWRALLGTPLQIPHSIRSADIRAYADADGGVRLVADLEDESSDLAERDSKQLKRDVDAITSLGISWLFAQARLTEALQVSTEDKHIHATLRITRQQVERILHIAEARLTPEGREDARRAATAHSADAGL